MLRCFRRHDPKKVQSKESNLRERDDQQPAQDHTLSSRGDAALHMTQLVYRDKEVLTPDFVLFQEPETMHQRASEKGEKDQEEEEDER